TGSHRFTEVNAAAIGCRLPFGEILPGTKTPPAPGNDQHACPLLLDLVQCIGQLPVHGRGKAVELVGPVQPDACNPVLMLELNVLVAHVRLLKRASGFAPRGTGWPRTHCLTARRWQPGWRRYRGSR